jgi:hypothetical protein
MAKYANEAAGFDLDVAVEKALGNQVIGDQYYDPRSNNSGPVSNYSQDDAWVQPIVNLLRESGYRCEQIKNPGNAALFSVEGRGSRGDGIGRTKPHALAIAVANAAHDRGRALL